MVGQILLKNKKGRGVVPRETITAHGTSDSNENSPPKLARRNTNRRSTLKTGRTLSAKRDRLETSSERAANHQRLKHHQRLRFAISFIASLMIISAVIGVGLLIAGSSKEPSPELSSTATPAIVYKPTIEVIDEDTGTSGTITSRMSEYIGQAEVDFRELGLIPIKAIIPAGAIREVDFYLDGHPGFIKMILDRDTAVSVEDAARMIHYLEEQGVTDYQYIDVRLSGRAYWK